MTWWLVRDSAWATHAFVPSHTRKKWKYENACLRKIRHPHAFALEGFNAQATFVIGDPAFVNSFPFILY